MLVSSARRVQYFRSKGTCHDTPFRRRNAPGGYAGDHVFVHHIALIQTYYPRKNHRLSMTCVVRQPKGMFASHIWCPLRPSTAHEAAKRCGNIGNTQIPVVAWPRRHRFFRWEPTTPPSARGTATARPTGNCACSPGPGGTSSPAPNQQAIYDTYNKRHKEGKHTEQPRAQVWGHQFGNLQNIVNLKFTRSKKCTRREKKAEFAVLQCHATRQIISDQTATQASKREKRAKNILLCPTSLGSNER